MKFERINIWKDEEYSYKLAAGFMPNMRAYLHNDEDIRPAVLICPGGGYNAVCPSEGKIVADMFYNMGYQAFVLAYTVDITSTEPLKLQPLNDVARAVRMIRSKADTYCVSPNKIAVCGFSAGGHLAASLCVHYKDIKDVDETLNRFSNRPDACILGYPVIDSRQHTHGGSILTLLGNNPAEEELDYMALHLHVTEDTPPCFIWQTSADPTVPVNNSYLFAEACEKAGVPFAHHIFTTGGHGLSTADEQWANREWEDWDLLEQVDNVIRLVKEGKQEYSEDSAMIAPFLMYDTDQEAFEKVFNTDTVPNEEVRIWPQLLRTWLKQNM